MATHRPFLPRLAAVTAASTLLATGLPAQQPEDSAPPVIQIGIETVRQGRGAAHTELEQRWAATFRNAGVPVYWLGTTTVTGPGEFWWFSALGAVADIEAQDKAVEGVPGLGSASDLLSTADAENVSGGRTMLARYRADLSRLGGVPVGQARYFQMIMFRIRPGQDSKFVEAAKLFGTVTNEANGTGHWATYQVFSGMTGNAFLVFISMKSLSEMDPGADVAAIQKAMTPARVKQFSELEAAGYISTTSYILQFQPRMSYLQPEVVAQDPSFWNVKP